MPSGPNRGPGAIRTPAAGASSARSVANGPGSRTQRNDPPAGWLGCQSGSWAANAACSAAAPVASRDRCIDNAGPGSVSNAVTTS